MKKRVFTWIQNAFLFTAVVCMVASIRDEEGTPVILMLLSNYLIFLINLFKRANLQDIIIAMLVYAFISLLFLIFVKRIEKKEKQEQESDGVE